MIRKLHNVNWTLVTAWLIVHGYLIGAAYLSFGHIIDVAATLGAGDESWTWPFMIDGFAILGRLGMSKRFAESTRKAGFKMLVVAGAASLVCNVMAGDTPGEKLTGLGVVLGFLVAEWFAGKLEGVPVAAAPEQPAAVIDPAEVAKEAKRQRDREARRIRDAVRRELARAETAAAIPVSPAPARPMPDGIHVPSAVEVAALVG